MGLLKTNTKSKKFLLHCFDPPPKEKGLLPLERHICPFIKYLTHVMLGKKSKLVPPRLFCWKKKKNGRCFDPCKDETHVCIVRQKCTGSGIYLGMQTEGEPLWRGHCFSGGRTELTLLLSLIQSSSRLPKTEALRPDQKMKLCIPWVSLLDSVPGTGICVHGGDDC